MCDTVKIQRQEIEKFKEGLKNQKGTIAEFRRIDPGEAGNAVNSRINEKGDEYSKSLIPKWVLAGRYSDWANLHNSEYLHLAKYKGGGGNTFVVDNGGALQYTYDYNLWEAISFFNFKIASVPVKLMLDYIVNTADDVPGNQDNTFPAEFKLDREKQRGDWSFLYKYARI